MFVTYRLRIGWTDWDEIFFTTSVLGRGRFSAINITDSFTGLPEIRKKPVFIVVYIYRYTIEIECRLFEKRLNLLSWNFVGSFLLVRGWFQAKKFPDRYPFSKTAEPIELKFTILIYWPIYTTPIEMKILWEASQGPGMVLG